MPLFVAFLTRKVVPFFLLPPIRINTAYNKTKFHVGKMLHNKTALSPLKSQLQLSTIIYCSFLLFALKDLFICSEKEKRKLNFPY